MKKLLGTGLLAIALCGSMAVPLLPTGSVAQDRDRDDERGYQNNHYYKQGWKDGEHHKQRKHKWKNDDDRRAYESGYSHGERGDKWSDHGRDRDDRH